MADNSCPIECRGIGVRFGGSHALSEVNFQLAEGEIHGLVGCNGAGKSTLMKVLAGVVPHYTGEVRIDGKLVHLDSPRTALQHGIGMVHQELSGISQLSVAENLFLGRQPRTPWGTIAWRTMQREATTALAELGLKIDVRRPLREFPLVSRQLVEIARGLQSRARVLILDEPTSALSLPESQRLFDVMRALKARGVSLVFISHFLEDVLSICDRVTVLRDGRVEDSQPTSQISRRELLGKMVGDASSSSVGEGVQETELTENIESPIRLRIDHFQRGKSFREISLRVRRGECLGLYGYVGAGHQELLYAIAGGLPIDRGERRLDNRPIRVRTTSDAIRRGIVLVAADRGQTVFRQASIARNVTLAHLTKSVGRWLLASREARVARPILQRVGCQPPNPWKPAGELSGGNQQKVVLGRWLLGPIEVLLLDEPTRGMDVHAKAEVMRLVKAEQERGAGVILASTEPELLLAHADRILTFSRGRITREFAAGRVTKADLMHAAEREPDCDD